MDIKNILTFDIEEWYHANYDNLHYGCSIETTTILESTIDQIIEMCARFAIYSTCFVLGDVARQKPSIVKKLYKAGHEIASHGYSHRLIYTMSPEEFKSDVQDSCAVLEDITGEKVVGYRAPSWSVKKEILSWYYDILEELGLRYSSSVYPAYTFLYGIPGFPPYCHYPVIDGRRIGIMEFPVPVTKLLWKRIGFSGGFFLRFFPPWFIKYILLGKNRNNQSCFIYLHPREFDFHQPRLALPFKERFIHYYGVQKTEKKLDNILRHFAENMVRMKDLLIEINS